MESRLYVAAWGCAALFWALLGAAVLGRIASGTGRRTALAVRLLPLGAALAALAGARLHFMLADPLGLLALLGEGRALELALAPGLRIGGGLLAGLAFLWGSTALLPRGQVPLARLLDRLTPVAGLVVAVGRLGCLAAGCCFGVPCARPWCVRHPPGSAAYWNQVARGLLPDHGLASLPTHPLPLYLAGAALLAAALALLVRRRAARDGTAVLAFVATLAASRLALEPLRETSFGLGVPGQRLLDGLALLTASVLLLVRRYRGASDAAARLEPRLGSRSSPGMPTPRTTRAPSPSAKAGSTW